MAFTAHSVNKLQLDEAKLTLKRTSEARVAPKTALPSPSVLLPSETKDRGLLAAKTTPVKSPNQSDSANNDLSENKNPNDGELKVLGKGVYRASSAESLVWTKSETMYNIGLKDRSKTLPDVRASTPSASNHCDTSATKETKEAISDVRNDVVEPQVNTDSGTAKTEVVHKDKHDNGEHEKEILIQQPVKLPSTRSSCCTIS